MSLVFMRPMGKFDIGGLDRNYHSDKLSSSLGLVCKQTSTEYYATRETIQQPLVFSEGALPLSPWVVFGSFTACQTRRSRRVPNLLCVLEIRL